MICIFCGLKDAPIVDRWSLIAEMGGRRRVVSVQNQPVCGDCMVEIQARMNKNEEIRRADAD
jgi:hypothetical protein